ncbi:hypothetical protein KUCAC02_003774 [Xyrichtys novacula]|uniref:Uncharacterized protein n=1 Tax=Xyrichtys novacula TaxID=13765 RepID=A0AAV1HN75_XYRNO|nr:hypothetical protein KUCAC02_003774 [Xyrichtys novacula]
MRGAKRGAERVSLLLPVHSLSTIKTHAVPPSGHTRGGNPQRTAVLVLLLEDTMMTVPQTLGVSQGGSCLITAPCPCIHALSETICYRNLQRMHSERRSEAQATTGDVGLMLGPQARKALRWVYHHTDRILSTEFSGNPVTAVIVVYSFTNAASSEQVESVWTQKQRM